MAKLVKTSPAFIVRSQKNGIYRALLPFPHPFGGSTGARFVTPEEANGIASEEDAAALRAEIDAAVGMRLAASGFSPPEVAACDLFPRKRVALVATWPDGRRFFCHACPTIAEAKNGTASIAIDFRDGATPPPVLYEVEPFEGPEWRPGAQEATAVLFADGARFAWEKTIPGLRVPFKCPPGTFPLPPTKAANDGPEHATIGTSLWSPIGAGHVRFHFVLRSSLPGRPQGESPYVVTSYSALYQAITSRRTQGPGIVDRERAAMRAIEALPEVRSSAVKIALWQSRGFLPSPYLYCEPTTEGVAALFAIHKRAHEIGS